MRKAFSLVVSLAVVLVLIGPGAVLGGTHDDERVDVFVVFKEAPGKAERALVEQAGGRVKYSYKIVPAIATNIPKKAAENLLKNPNVVLIEPDGELYLLDFETELQNTWGVERIGAGEAHQGGHFGEKVKVAVIDTGIDYNHPELKDIYAGGWDFVNGDDDPMDDNGHGTHVAGTIAAARDGVGVVGVSPGVELYALKVCGAFGFCDLSAVIAAIDWAVLNGIQVTNNSYGSSPKDASCSDTLLRDAFSNAYVAGVLHVAAAGNSSADGAGVICPANFESVIAVAATDKNNQRASFSSTGPEVELAAPGVGVNSTRLGGGYRLMRGTSMASPHVAGTAALVMGIGVTENDIARQILRDTAEELGDPNWYGYGLVRADLATQAAIEEMQARAFRTKISSIEYDTVGGINGDLNLVITGRLLNGLGEPVDGAWVSADVKIQTTEEMAKNVEGRTNRFGEVTWWIAFAPPGIYRTTVTAVIKESFTWDGKTPENSFAKRGALLPGWAPQPLPGR